MPTKHHTIFGIIIFTEKTYTYIKKPNCSWFPAYLRLMLHRDYEVQKVIHEGNYTEDEAESKMLELGCDYVQPKLMHRDIILREGMFNK